MEGRRARLRAHLLGEIRTAALGELRRVGAAQLSLREVARAAGISPSGLYRYVDGRDALLELLITDGFEDFGTAIDEAIDAAGDDAIARMEAVALTYRRWALENPEQFGLILGTPVPGFRARDDGPTVEGAKRFSEPMIRVITGAYDAHRESAPDEGTLALSEPVIGIITRAWGRIHGLVALETFGHLGWVGTDVEALLRDEVVAIAGELGITQAAKTRNRV